MPKIIRSPCDTTLLTYENVCYVIIQSLLFEAPPIPSLQAHNPPILLEGRESPSSLSVADQGDKQLLQHLEISKTSRGTDPCID